MQFAGESCFFRSYFNPNMLLCQQNIAVIFVIYLMIKSNHNHFNVVIIMAKSFLDDHIECQSNVPQHCTSCWHVLWKTPLYFATFKIVPGWYLRFKIVMRQCVNHMGPTLPGLHVNRSTMKHLSHLPLLL